jgi:3-oxoadipate enol-lactonase
MMHKIDWIDSNGVWLRFAEDGKGDATVILVHEMGGTLDSWDEVVPYLSENYRVLRYDMRGYGLSQKVFGSYTLDDAISDLTGFIDAFDLKGPIALVGGAVGAGVSMRVAALRPEQIKALVAMAPATEIAEERLANTRAMPDRIASLGSRRLIDEAIAPGSFPEILRDNPERYRRFRAQQASMDPESFAATFTMLLEGVYRPYFRQIECPTLVVAGEYDKVRTPAMVEQVASEIPGARYEVIPSGHFMAIQTPELVGELLASFLEEKMPPSS